MGIKSTSRHRVRPARLSDLDALLEIEESAFAGDRFSRARYRYLLTRANASSVVATEAGEVAGVMVMLWRRNSQRGHLYTIAVHPKFHGKGYGRILMEECIRLSRAKGCDRIVLEVRADNRGAINLYRKFGFEVTETLPNYYEDGGDGYRMVRELSRDTKHPSHIKRRTR